MEFNENFFIGGLVCVDFVNTFDHLHDPPAFDYFQDPGNIASWARAAGILPGKSAPTAPSKRAAADLVALRSRIFRVLWPLARGNSPSRTDLDAFNADWQKSASRRRIVGTNKGFLLAEESADPFELIAGKVISSTADFLLANRGSPVRQCGGCGWLFLDASRNGMRRWCTMKICGNRAKARRHYERIRR